MLLLKKQLYVTEEAREVETSVKEAVFAESETALDSPVKEEHEVVLEQAIVTEEVTEAETNPKSLVIEEPDAIVEEAVVTEGVTEAKTTPVTSQRRTCDCCGGSHCDRRSYRSSSCTRFTSQGRT